MNFDNLTVSIAKLDESLRRSAAGAVNRTLTIRNWLIGRHIVEFEQDGDDRAQYGNKHLKTLSGHLRDAGAKGMSYTNLTLFRHFYRCYPQIGQLLHQFRQEYALDNHVDKILQKASEEFEMPHQLVDIKGVTSNDSLGVSIGQKPSDQCLNAGKVEIVQKPSAQSDESHQPVDNKSVTSIRSAAKGISQKLSDESPWMAPAERKTGDRQKQQKPSAELQPVTNQCVTDISPGVEPCRLLRHFSFSHFVELMRIDDPVKRAFYEIEGIKGAWSVPQLKRQIESLLYERTGMSKDKVGLVETVHAENRVAAIEDTIRDPYVLEFTGFPEQFQYSEADLETALLDHIQSFLIELGNGFCFEARQKRITLDNEHDRIDLVFYHRILRCHVLIDLKVRKFRHSDAGQMNFYLNYYKEEVMAEGDNPPVGLVLCTDRDETRVKYATGGMDGSMFVSKYLTMLPSEENLMRFLENDRDRTENVLLERMAVYE